MIFSYAGCHWRILSLLFYKTFAMIIFLSLKCFSVYFSMELFIGYLKSPIKNSGGGGLKWYEYVRNGGLVACVLVLLLLLLLKIFKEGWLFSCRCFSRGPPFKYILQLKRNKI